MAVDTVRCYPATSTTRSVRHTLTVPALVTHGEEDTVVLPSMARHVLDVCPTAKASWYEGMGHAPFIEDTERFNRELADFTRHANS